MVFDKYLSAALELVKVAVRTYAAALLSSNSCSEKPDYFFSAWWPYNVLLCKLYLNSLQFHAACGETEACPPQLCAVAGLSR